MVVSLKRSLTSFRPLFTLFPPVSPLFPPYGSAVFATRSRNFHQNDAVLSTQDGEQCSPYVSPTKPRFAPIFGPFRAVSP